MQRCRTTTSAPPPRSPSHRPEPSVWSLRARPCSTPENDGLVAGRTLATLGTVSKVLNSANPCGTFHRVRAPGAAAAYEPEKAHPARTPSRLRMEAAGQKPVKLACSMLRPTNAVSSSHQV